MPLSRDGCTHHRWKELRAGRPPYAGACCTPVPASLAYVWRLGRPRSGPDAVPEEVGRARRSRSGARGPRVPVWSESTWASPRASETCHRARSALSLVRRIGKLLFDPCLPPPDLSTLVLALHECQQQADDLSRRRVASSCVCAACVRVRLLGCACQPWRGQSLMHQHVLHITYIRPHSRTERRCPFLPTR